VRIANLSGVPFGPDPQLRQRFVAARETTKGS
jgi:hypothetical protein